MVTKNLMARLIIGLLTLISCESAFGSSSRRLTIPEEHAISSQPRSLRNATGASCYMHAGLQLLSGLRDFNKQVILMQHEYVNPSVATDYINFLHSPSEQIGLEPAICPTSLKIRGIRPNEQEDSYLFVNWLLDQLSDESLLPKFRDKANPIYPPYEGTALRRSPLTSLYAAELVSTVFHQGKIISQKPEWVGGFDLPISGNTLEKCFLDDTSKNSPIDEYELPDGNKVNNASVKKRLVNLPQYLFLHLQRGAQGELRNQTVVTFPIENFRIATANNTDLFNLVGFVMHAGTASAQSGHYIAYTKNKGQWYKCDDSSICQLGVSDEVALIARTGKGRPGTATESSEEHYLPTIFVYEKQSGKSSLTEKETATILKQEADKKAQEEQEKERLESAAREAKAQSGIAAWKAFQKKIEDERKAKADKARAEAEAKTAQILNDAELAKKAQAEIDKKAAQEKADAQFALELAAEESRKAEQARAARAEVKANAEKARAEAEAKAAQIKKDEELAKKAQAEIDKKAAQEKADAQFAADLAAEESRKANLERMAREERERSAQDRAARAQKAQKAEQEKEDARLAAQMQAEEARKADVQRMAREERERSAQDGAARAARAEAARREAQRAADVERMAREEKSRQAEERARRARIADVEKMRREEQARQAEERARRGF